MPSIHDCKCVLVVGATSGIGRALALSILALPTKPTVIVSGRRQERLYSLAQQHAGENRLKTLNMDVNADPASLKVTVKDIVGQYPNIDAIIFSAGIQHQFDFTKPDSVDLDSQSSLQYICAPSSPSYCNTELSSELNTNYTSIVSMITFFLPHLIQLGKQGRPTFIYTVTSSLAIVPGAWVPNYCATKAALHSLSLTLNAQLRDSNVHVVEIFPPLVESELHDHQGVADTLSRFWMPLDEFTKLTMERLENGDVQAPIGPSVRSSYEQFEEGKLDRVFQMYEGQKKQESRS
ncbi:hypothetical protein SERLA73DRAFT_174621 [Serpula lacrymans var. lacrymans S7.3]|uniref:NAD(P)-binding protein n=2 Tax=Serpula lacrymans var. lacrymans TaxID=341189 RepID=F8PJ18_SERL3|nr:uncharacterized protein SERLADRAFT_456230 [Serpula lacrymans var. lacrymans S7.9]EGO03179.1 hypothetical protein SERLA73DRAFT_174621 [Serpula lacrymans var. lacrymans S7.3]EGO28956.1 hypothetical protein SERLADRAFT_456230 [Serpula lacrymans var. lacrymans S7.9]